MGRYTMNILFSHLEKKSGGATLRQHYTYEYFYTVVILLLSTRCEYFFHFRLRVECKFPRIQVNDKHRQEQKLFVKLFSGKKIKKNSKWVTRIVLGVQYSLWQWFRE